MKKNFFKKMSVVLALAMTVATVAPAATTASAAAAPVFKSKSVNLKVGQTKNYNMDNVTPWSVKKFVTGNKKVATVAKSGKTAKVTGVGEGKTTLRADLKAYKSKRDLQVRVPVTVVPDKAEIKSAVQNTVTKYTINFSAKLESVKTEDFSLVRDNDNTVIALKSVALDSNDATKVNLETFASLKDGKTYTVTYDGKSTSFVATDGTVTDLNVTPVTITKASLTEIKAQTKDAQGVLLNEYTLSGAAGETSITFTINTTEGYTDGDKLFLFEEGNTATAKVTYHTFKWDESGNEIGKVEKEVTITAVKDATTVSNFKYTIANSAPNWSKTVDAVTRIALGDTKSAYFCFKDSNDNDVTNRYNVVSSDESKVLINYNGMSSSTGVSVVGVAVGSAYILVKDGDGNVITSLPITVLDARKASTLNLDTTSFAIANTAAGSKTVGLTLKDQYGDDIAINTINISNLSKPNGAIEPGYSGNTSAKNVTFIGTGATAGDYNYKIEAKDAAGNGISRTISVKLVEPTSAITYKLELAGVDATNKVDLKVAGDAADPAAAVKTVSVKVATVQNGVVSGYLSAVSGVSITKPDGGTVSGTDGAIIIDIADETVATLNLSSDATGGVLSKDLATGSYTVKVTMGTTTLTTGFNVVDTQAGATVDVKKVNTGLTGTLKDAFATSNNCVDVYFEGDKQTLSASDVLNFENGDYVQNGNTVAVYSVRVNVQVSPGVKTMVKIPVNRTFTFTDLTGINNVL